VGFVVDKVALGQVFSEYFGFRGYNWATLFLGDINMRTWHFRLKEY
jgi:hypothetical protein